MKLLIVGAGSIGSRHAQNAVKFSTVGIVDINSDQANKVAKEYNCKSFGDNLTLALSWNCEGVIISTPNKMHIKVATKAIESGSDVLIEKPIGCNTSEVEEFLEYAAKLNRKVFVVCNMRFHPAIQAIYNNLHLIGNPLFARAHFGNYLPDMRPNVNYRDLYVANADEGGVVLDGIHEIDYLSWFFGKVKNIAAQVSRISSLEINADDYAGLLIEHESKLRSEIHLDFLRRIKRRGCEISGTDGLIHWISEGKSPERCVVRLYTPSYGWKNLLSDDMLNGNQSMENMLKDFIGAINGKENILQTGFEALLLLKATLIAREGTNAKKIS
jgi:predicted dehydrogenase